MPLDYHTKLPRGFGFVEFSRDEDAEAALEALSRHAVLDGSEVSVTVAQQGRKSPDSMRIRDVPSRGRRDDYRRDGRDDYRRDDYDGRRRGRSHSARRRYDTGRSRSRSVGDNYDRRRYDEGYRSSRHEEYRRRDTYRNERRERSRDRGYKREESLTKLNGDNRRESPSQYQHINMNI